LEEQGLGLPLRQRMCVKAVLDDITNNQGGFVQGSNGAKELLDMQAKLIVEMVRTSGAPVAAASSHSLPHTPPDFVQQLQIAQAETETAKRRVKELEEENKRLRVGLTPLAITAQTSSGSSLQYATLVICYLLASLFILILFSLYSGTSFDADDDEY